MRVDTVSSSRYKTTMPWPPQAHRCTKPAAQPNQVGTLVVALHSRRPPQATLATAHWQLCRHESLHGRVAPIDMLHQWHILVCVPILWWLPYGVCIATHSTILSYIYSLRQLNLRQYRTPSVQIVGACAFHFHFLKEAKGVTSSLGSFLLLSCSLPPTCNKRACCHRDF